MQKVIHELQEKTTKLEEDKHVLITQKHQQEIENDTLKQSVKLKEDQLNEKTKVQFLLLINNLIKYHNMYKS